MWKPLRLSAWDKWKFREWAEIAFYLHAIQRRLQFYENEIWYCHLGMNIGNEEMGKDDTQEYLRPLLILKKFSNHMCLVVPLTSTIKEAPYSYTFTFRDKRSAAMLTQIRSIDAQRLHTYMGIIPKMTARDFKEITKRLITFLS